MPRLSVAEVARVALDSGFTGEAAAVATAIAMAESGGDTAAVGDSGIQTRTWGPSIGLWQIRSLKADTGTGRERDGTANLNPVTNGKHAFAISGGGTNWRAWSVYTSGAYRTNLGSARMAVGAPAASVSGGDASLAGNPFAPLFDGGMWARLGLFGLGGLMLLFGLFRMTGIGSTIVKGAKVAVKARTGVSV